MIRAEHRRACIEAAVRAAHRRYYHDYTTINGPESWECEPVLVKGRWIASQEAALDALPSAGARVVPAEATEEMIAAAWKVLNPCGENCIDKFGTGPAVREAYAAMAAAGDLTKPPEGKT